MHDGVVLVVRSLEQEPPKSRPVEDLLHHDGAAHDEGEDSAEERHDRYERVAQHVTDHYGALAKTLASGGPHVVLPEDLQDLRSQVPRIRRDPSVRVQEHRPDHVPHPVPAESAALADDIHAADRKPPQLDAEHEDKEKSQEEVGYRVQQDGRHADRVIDWTTAKQGGQHAEWHADGEGHEQTRDRELQAVRDALRDELYRRSVREERLAEVEPHHAPGPLDELERQRAVESVRLANRLAILCREIGDPTDHDVDGVGRRDPGQQERQQHDPKQRRDRLHQPAQNESSHRRLPLAFQRQLVTSSATTSRCSRASPG